MFKFYFFSKIQELRNLQNNAMRSLTNPSFSIPRTKRIHITLRIRILPLSSLFYSVIKFNFPKILFSAKTIQALNQMDIILRRENLRLLRMQSRCKIRVQSFSKRKPFHHFIRDTNFHMSLLRIKCEEHGATLLGKPP